MEWGVVVGEELKYATQYLGRKLVYERPVVSHSAKVTAQSRQRGDQVFDLLSANKQTRVRLIKLVGTQDSHRRYLQDF